MAKLQRDKTITHKKLVKKIFLRGRVHVITGLHIGGSNMQLEIGGIDNAVIRHPFTQEPYLPGSSLKGKMRALMEQAAGTFGRGIGRSNFGPTEDPEASDLVMLFGNAKGEEENIPSRLIVRDGILLNADEMGSGSDLPFTEVKTEVNIDRLTSAATPRQVERVPAGAQFSLDLVINVWEDQRDSDKKSPKTHFFPELAETTQVQYTLNALRMLQDDYLGGKGSRGSGQIAIDLDPIVERSAAFYQGKTEEKDAYQPSQHRVPEDLTYRTDQPV